MELKITYKYSLPTYYKLKCLFHGAETSKSSCLKTAEKLLAAPTVSCNYYRLRLPPRYYTRNSAKKRQPVQGKVVLFNPRKDEL